MKKKSNNMIRLSDELTQLNSDLIDKLSKNDQMESAWYLNGRVYGQVWEQRVVIDIFDDITLNWG